MSAMPRKRKKNQSIGVYRDGPFAAANEMMNACRGLGIDANDFVVAHRVYRRMGGQS